MIVVLDLGSSIPGPAPSARAASPLFPAAAPRPRKKGKMPVANQSMYHATPSDASPAFAAPTLAPNLRADEHNFTRRVPYVDISTFARGGQHDGS